MTLELYPNGRLLKLAGLTDTIGQYYSNKGLVKGLSTGWLGMDDLFLLQKGMLNIVTGIPSSGKSEWLDQLMLQTIAQHKWHWTVFSPENWPVQHHFQKLAEKWTGFPMFPWYNKPHMSFEMCQKALREISPSIDFVEPPKDSLALEPILELLKQSSEDNATDAFILDPWNEIESNRPKNMTETEYIGAALSRLRNFGRQYNIAMFIVAHPTKLQKDNDGNYPVPTPYDISGSANWRNKADSCISVWRNYQQDDGVVQIHVQKVRNKNLGKLGKVDLFWNKANGLFFDNQADLKEEQHHGIRRRAI